MILVVGATGNLGSIIVARLLEKRESVRVLVRAGRETAPLEALGAEIAVGDLKDPDSLRDACRGIDVVVTTANSAARGGEDTAETVDRIGNRNLVLAATSEGARRFVFVSAYGASLEHPHPFFRAKAETEQALQQSNLSYAILAPDLFSEVWLPAVVGARVAADEPVTLVAPATHRHSFISADDVAAFAVAAARGGTGERVRLELGGPEALSWRDVVERYERVLGRTLEVRTVEPGQPIEGLPEFVTGFLAALETFDSVIDSRSLAARLGVQMRTVEEVVRNQLVGA